MTRSGTMQTYLWISFCDDRFGFAGKFLGVAVLKSADLEESRRQAHRLGINPGGQAAGVLIHTRAEPPAELLNHLVTDKAKLAELEKSWFERDSELAF